MRILVADDHPDSRGLLKTLLTSWVHDVTLARDGGEAFDILNRSDAPPLAIIDGMMPVMDGIELCQAIRRRDREISPSSSSPAPPYIMILTAKNTREDMIAGLRAGADDYITKPFDRDELRVRIGVASRIIHLQQELAGRVRHLEEALAGVRQLQGLLPICSYCKRVRDDKNYWQQVDDYIAAHTDAQLSHGICPACYVGVVQPQLDSLREKRRLANSPTRTESIDSIE